MSYNQRNKAIAAQAISTIRKILNAPPCEVCWWGYSLNRKERKLLLWFAGLNRDLHSKSWDLIPPSHRRRIIDAACRIADLVKDILLRREAKKHGYTIK